MSAGRPTAFGTTVFVLALAFLYGPILLVVAFSFNASRLVTVWSGASLHWYGALLANEPLRQSALLSLEVALLSAAAATCLGTLAATALSGMRRGWRASALTGTVYVPLVMPEVITGLALLLLFVAMGVPRGVSTVVLAHAALTMPFVTIVVRAKLAELSPRLVEAAADLGAGPLAAFWTVTLPLAAPGIVAGFLLAFTMSLDDLIIASFTSGPGATTLPMRIYSQVRLGVTPEINAASTLLVGAAAVAAVAATWIGGRSRRQARIREPARRPGPSRPAGRSRVPRPTG